MNPTNEFNPLATDLRALNPGVAVSNLAGVWSFQYKQANHNTSSKTIFPGKTVPARFGPPYAGRNYQLRSEEHTSELQSHSDLVCRLLLEKKKARTAVPSRTTQPS